MINDPDDQQERAQELRRQAEKRLRGTIVDEQQLTDMAPEAIRSLVHELQTHHVELEMQNEMLRQTEEALVSSRDQFVELYDFSPVGYCTIAANGQIAEANLTACALLGVEREALLGKAFAQYIVAEDQDRYYLHSKEVLSMQQRQACELRLKKADGTSFYSRLDSQAVAADTSFRVAISDISANKEIEKKIIRLERLNAIGELAAGVSHNLNNMLTGVIVPAQILHGRIEDPKLRVHLADIIKSGHRMAELVQKMHHFVHLSDREGLEAIDLNAAVNRAVELSRSRWQDEAQEQGILIKILNDLQAVPPIRGTSAELESLLLNLLLNAVDALPAGGTIALQTRPIEGGAQLTISDTGTGIDPETKHRIFEPFFTTKKSVGTGLGLSTAYRTMRDWGGEISVESTLGQGTTFTLNFHTISLPPPAAVVVDEPELQPAAGRILVVEDSDIVVATLCRTLSKHHVESAQDGIEALKNFAESRYDAVLIDLGLPKITGDQVAQSMRQIDPAVALVLITGWQLKDDDERLSHFDFYMQKPFGDLGATLNTINQALALCRKRKNA